MSKPLKALIISLLVIVVVLVGIGTYISMNISTLVRDAVETQGSRTTGTPVRLGSAHFVFLTGRVGLSNLVIDNPDGFKTPHAFRMKSLVMAVDLPTVFDEVIVINEFGIDGAQITAEQVGTSLKTNLQVIADHAKAANPPDPSKNRSNADKPPRLIVKRLALTANRVDLVSEQWGDRQVSIPDIVLKDLGKKEGGLTPDQLSQQVLQAMTREINRAVRHELEAIAKEKARDTITGKIKEKLGSWFSE